MIHSAINSEWPDQIPLHVLGLLEPEESVAFEVHLNQCSTCLEEVAAFRETVSEMAFAAPVSTLSRGLRRRLLTQTAPVSLFVRADQGVWKATGFDGVESRHLFTDPATGNVTTMVRMKAGASWPAHHHKGYEHCYVLEGDVSCDDHTLHAGDYEVNAPGTDHGALWSTNGCLLLLVLPAG